MFENMDQNEAKGHCFQNTLKYVQDGLKSVKLLDWLGFFYAAACFSKVPRTCTRTGRTFGIFLQDERHRATIHTAVIQYAL